jgi:hypothetical protein
LIEEIRAVFPASGNKCGQLAQASFSRIYFATGGEKYWSKETTPRI